MAVVLGCSTFMTSCTDYLTLYPTNSVILENYWKTAEDVNGMLATCYKNMVQKSTIERMMIWGELRADNMITRTNASTDLKYIVEANLLETNGYFNWAVFYQTINYCNMLIKYAPGVMEEDPDFTQGDLEVVMGEAYALRALCHFYLVRSFRDIPLALEAMDADEQEMVYPQRAPMEVLDSIMVDLERASGLVMKKGGFTYDSYNYGRITRNAVYAMMADVNLWRAAFTQYEEALDAPSAKAIEYYTKAIENCDSVIEPMQREMIEMYEKRNEQMTEVGPGTKNPYFLIPNETTKAQMVSESYNEIFGMEGSTESIFELVMDGSTNANGAVTSHYGYSKTTGSFIAPAKAPITQSLYGENDLRLYSFTNAPLKASGDDKTEYTIAKYAARRSPLNGEANANYWHGSSECPANWIIYRKTDVMLMKAQALAYRSDDAADLSKAFELVTSVNRRSLIAERDTLKFEQYNTQELMKNLVLDERLRELTFEGKRWYDLVQKALIERSTKSILELITKKLDSNAGAVQSKMASINSLFCPIYERELKLNPLLKQNPAFENNSSIEQN